MSLNNNYHEAGLAAATLTHICHNESKAAGWWNEYYEMPEQYKKYFLATKLGLIHSEASEAFEGLRKGKMDDHLPTRLAAEVELADLAIRLFDLGGALGMDIGGAVAEKMAYNAQRADHKPEARAAAGGKSF